MDQKMGSVDEWMDVIYGTDGHMSGRGGSCSSHDLALPPDASAQEILSGNITECPLGRQ